MTTELHAHAALTVTGTADMLEHGRDADAIDELRLAAVLRRDSVRLTAEISRLPKTEDDDGLAVEFVADVDRETLVRLGRLLLALADDQVSTPSPSSPTPTRSMIVRLLQERDYARAEVDEYRRAAGLRLAEFIGPDGTVALIRDRLAATRCSECGGSGGVLGQTAPSASDCDACDGYGVVETASPEASPDLVPGGCAACPHATARFNGGNGATTCAQLDDKIVAYGPSKPTTAPSECPRLATDDCETTPLRVREMPR